MNLDDFIKDVENKNKKLNEHIKSCNPILLQKLESEIKVFIKSVERENETLKQYLKSYDPILLKKLKSEVGKVNTEIKTYTYLLRDNSQGMLFSNRYLLEKK